MNWALSSLHGKSIEIKLIVPFIKVLSIFFYISVINLRSIKIPISEIPPPKKARTCFHRKLRYFITNDRFKFCQIILINKVLK